MSKNKGRNIKLVEVGARDGLQNETVKLSIEVRLELARKLAEAGLKEVEVGAFVSPTWVPQMAGSSELFRLAFESQAQGTFPKETVLSALVPNPRGMEDAVKVGVKNIAIFGSASESFSQKNINCSIEESLKRFSQVIALAKPNGIRVRGYLSMCFGCPYEGSISEAVVVHLVKRLLQMGVCEVSLGDTIGVADPRQVKSLLGRLESSVDLRRIALHFHDTRGTALANILASLDYGIRIFDSSIGGLGGCPYAAGAAGNVATEDVVYMLQRMGFKTDIDLAKLIEINKWISQQMGKVLPSRVGNAGIPQIRPLN